MGVRNSAPIKQEFIQVTQKQISLGDFELIRPLQHVSRGNILHWIVEQIGNPKQMVMKIIPKLQLYNDKKIKAYIRQLFLMVTYQHPFLLVPFYAFQNQYNLYLVTENVIGGYLSSQLEQMKYKEDDAKNFIACLFIALNYLHEKGIIHTGVNPNNILIDADGYPKIAGLSSSCSGFRIEEEINEYMAPEVLEREEISFEADYYSVGIILYEIMAQRKLLQDEDLYDFILNKQCQVKKSDLSEEWSLDAADFINKLIQKNPVNRIGYYGFFDIKKHVWLQKIQWSKLEEKAIAMLPPRIQTVKAHERGSLVDIDSPIIYNEEFQNQFCMFYYRYDQEVSDIDYSQFQ